MKIVKGNVFDSTDRFILVTCNSFIKKDTSLVMGRGAALEMKTRYPGIDLEFGKYLMRRGLYKGDNFGTRYALCIIGGNTPYREKGIFQVKYHFRSQASLDLIKFSCGALVNFLGINDQLDTVSMNFPGIGFGGLEYEVVLPIVSMLPDTVSLYIKE